MKKMKQLIKCITIMFSLCLLFNANEIAQAAKYQPNVTYVNPEINSKDEYYSVKKMRMDTYGTTSFDVVYPKGATISVSTNKKALQAMITQNTYESPYYENGVRVNVEPQEIYYSYYYYDAENNETYYYKQRQNGYESYKLWYNETTKKCYYHDDVWDDTTKSWIDKEYEVDADKVEVNYAIYTDQDGTKYYFDGTNYDMGGTSDYQYYVWDNKNYYGYYVDYYWLNKDATGYYIYDNAGKTYKSYLAEIYDDGSRYEYSVATIQLDSTKKGTYKVNVIVNDVKTTLTVYVTPYGDNIYTKMKLGDETIDSIKVTSTSKNYTYKHVTNYKVKSSLKSAKLKLTANKGMQINGFVVASVDEDGDVAMKAYKNGKKIKLSQGYAETGYNATENTKYTKPKKETYVCVSYTDKYTKTSVKYSVVKKHGVKQIKEVYKAANGKKYTNYYNFGEIGFALWSY